MKLKKLYIDLIKPLFCIHKYSEPKGNCDILICKKCNKTKTFIKNVLPTDYYIGKVLTILFVLSVSFLKAQTLPVNQTISNTFNYMLPQDEAHISAGVYSGGVLIRTLFSDSTLKAGTHTGVWNGLDDSGNLMTIGTTYQIKILASNITYTWEGTIGNNSTDATGPHKWAGYGSQLSDATEVDSAGTYKMYCGTYFAEYSPAQMYFYENTPNKKTTFLNTSVGQATVFTCSDATKVYYAGWDYQHAYNYVIATTIVGDALYHFPSGSNVTPPRGQAYTGVADLNSFSVTGQASGMDVQKTGNYLFVAHKNQNTITVLNKVTGALVQTISITGATNIKLETDNMLWIAQGTTFSKYAVNSDGTITSTGTQITGFSRIGGADIYNGTIYILDAGNQQIPKFFNSTTLAPITKGIWITGGYATSPSVADNKLYEEDLGGTYYTFIKVQHSDGSFWIGDPGNDRYQHYDSSGNYINNIMYISTHYGASICLNNNTRVFSNLTEFAMDYTQPFASSWTLVKNWRYNLPSGWYNTNTPLGSVVTLTNGRTYGVLRNAATGTQYIAEFTSSGLRIPSSAAPSDGITLDSLGNAYTRGGITGTYPNQNALIKKYPITGFDGSNNPTYGALTTVLTLPLGSRAGAPGQSNWNMTASGNFISYMNLGNSSSTNYMHLSGYNSGVRIWQALQETFRSYAGVFPKAWFDVGNLVNQPGSEANVLGNNIIAGYHGEFWKNSQTNIFWHYSHDGLMFGQFGVTGPAVQGDQAPPGYAGNALAIKLTSYNGDIYLFHSDEEHGAGLHEWVISNLSSIYRQTINLTLTNRVLTIPANQTDLLAGLGNNESISGYSGWTASPTEYFTNNNDRFKTLTRQLTYDYTTSPDIVITGAHTVPGSIYYIERTLPPTTTVNNWTIGGILDLQTNSFNSFKSSSTGIFEIDILDNNHKVICKLIPYRDHTVNFNTVNYGPYGGNEWIGAGNYNGVSKFSINRITGTNNVFLSINLFATQLTSIQAEFDNTANIAYPKYFRIQFNWLSAPIGVQFGIIKLNYQ